MEASAESKRPYTSTHALNRLILISAGESSGDVLGALLMQRIQKLVPGCVFVGSGGPMMAAQGLKTLFQADNESSVGLDGIFKELPRVFKRWQLFYRYAQKHRPALFIGVDLPDFNLRLAKKLRPLAIQTIQYVGPTVWAWRKWRMRSIKKYIDLMLLIFPFESSLYRQAGVANLYLGHPLAATLSKVADPAPTRRRLKLRHNGPVIAVLPGSRSHEIARHTRPFFKACALFYAENPTAQFIVPLAKPSHRSLIQAQLPQTLPIRLLDEGSSRDAIAASDAVLLASGTSALEAALINRPMVMGYRVSWLTYGLGILMVHGRKKGLCAANFLAQERTVTELIQYALTAKNIVRALQSACFDASSQKRMDTQFDFIRQSLSLEPEAMQQCQQVLRLFLENAMKRTTAVQE